MGTDKAFLKLFGIPLIEHVLQALRSVCSSVIIVTNTPQRYDACDALVVTDALEMRGPLTGIYSGLLRSIDIYNMVVACDMPFLDQRLITYMAGLTEGYDIVVPRLAGYVEPLHAIYHRRLLPVIEDRIRKDDQRILGIYSEARVRYITKEEVDRFDPDHRSFRNLNTREEYKEATCLDLECRS